MCNSTPSAVFHVSPDLTRHPDWCGLEDDVVEESDDQTVDTMTIDELDALDNPEDHIPADFPAEYLHDTEAFDA
jgi:hypothetical protein